MGQKAETSDKNAYIFVIPDDRGDKRNTISYVIINPSYDTKLHQDDIM